MASLLACGAMAVGGATVAQGAGNKLSATVKVTPSKPKVKQGKTTPVKLMFVTHVTKSGAREDPVTALDVSFPKGLVMDSSGYKTCSANLIKANQVARCPSNSLIGDHTGLVNGKPLFNDPLHLIARVYVTSKSRNKIGIMSYGTSKELPSVHGVEPGYIKLSGGVLKFHLEPPVLRPAPGLPPATSLESNWNFDVRGSKGLLLRASKSCSGGWKLPAKMTFLDRSTASTTAKAGC
jgi:hypothetical protein